MADDFQLPEHGNINNFLESAYLSAVLQDWAQTRKIARDPDRFTEKNTILGEHPSQKKVDTYMLLRMLGHYGASRVFPDEIAIPLQLASLAEVGKAVGNNRKQGLGGINKPLLGASALASYLLFRKGKGTDNNGLPEGVTLYDDKDSKANFKPDVIDGAPGGRVNFYW